MKSNVNNPAKKSTKYDNFTFNNQKKALIVARYFKWPEGSGADIIKKEFGNRLMLNGIETHLVSHNRVKQTSELKFRCHYVKKSFFNLVSFGLGVRKLISRIKPDFVILTQAFGYLDLISLIRAASGIPVFYSISACFPLCNRLFGDLFNGRKHCTSNFFISPRKCYFCSMRVLRDTSKWWRIAILKRQFFDSFFLVPWSNFLVKHYLKKVRMIMVMNSFLKKELDRVLDGKVPIAVVPGGVNTNIFIPKPTKSQKTKKVIYLPGRSDSPAKGLSMLLKASKTLYRKRKDFEIIIDKHVPNLPTYVKVTKWVHNPYLIAKRYQTADIVVIPSLSYDAGPLTLLEAMSCGIPVIASNIGGPPDIVEEGKDGFLVTPNDFRDLAKKLEILLENENLAAKMGASARKKVVKKRTWDYIFTNCVVPHLPR